ncbi:TatD-related deoxyribonuclease [gut metagenome]|uniref:TatD-related deoxyribonuclease n=1 Tax=gut metagenome TaxID=749906 RepID=J9GM75_9ZZZZ
MIFPIDIHTHHLSQCSASAIVNCFPDTFCPEIGGWYSIGYHPWFLPMSAAPMRWELFEKLLAHPQVLAVGEAGLDKYAEASLSFQLKVFAHQVVLSERVGKPMVIHLVKALDELLRLKREMCPVQPWIIHGFRGKPALAEMLLHHGFYLSFGEKYQEETLKRIPVDRLFLETDESSLSIELCYKRVALLRGCSEKELLESVSRNVKVVFFNQ